MTCQLSYNRLGDSGPALVILHGLFGSADNWRAVGKALSDRFHVILVDLRNHGQSPHSDDMSYRDMANDVKELCDRLSLNSIIVMGHSMGGKVAMTLASDYPQLVKTLIVVDIAPKSYAPHHQDILAGLKAVEIESPYGSRSQANTILSRFIKEDRVRQFLLKSYVPDLDAGCTWQFNFKAVSEGYMAIAEAPPLKLSSVPTYFIRGEQSFYIAEDDIPIIETYFAHYHLISIPNAGHWVHAEQFAQFMQTIDDLLRV
jgi:esterase